MPKLELNNKIFIISAAADGIGLAIADKIVKNGIIIFDEYGDSKFTESIGVDKFIPSTEKSVLVISGFIVVSPGTMATSSNP